MVLELKEPTKVPQAELPIASTQRCQPIVLRFGVPALSPALLRS